MFVAASLKLKLCKRHYGSKNKDVLLPSVVTARKLARQLDVGSASLFTLPLASIEEGVVFCQRP
jgi:hypothetical protein